MNNITRGLKGASPTISSSVRFSIALPGVAKDSIRNAFEDALRGSALLDCVSWNPFEDDAFKSPPIDISWQEEMEELILRLHALPTNAPNATELEVSLKDTESVCNNGLPIDDQLKDLFNPHMLALILDDRLYPKKKGHSPWFEYKVISHAMRMTFGFEHICAPRLLLFIQCVIALMTYAHHYFTAYRKTEPYPPLFSLHEQVGTWDNFSDTLSRVLPLLLARADAGALRKERGPPSERSAKKRG